MITNIMVLTCLHTLGYGVPSRNFNMILLFSDLDPLQLTAVHHCGSLAFEIVRDSPVCRRHASLFLQGQTYDKHGTLNLTPLNPRV